MCIWDGSVSAPVGPVPLEPHCGAVSGGDAPSAGVACRRDRTSGDVMPCFWTPLRGRQHGGEPDGAFYPEIPDWLSALDLRLTDTCRLLEQKMGLKADALVELAGRAVEEVRQMFKNSTMPVLHGPLVSALRVQSPGLVLFVYSFAQYS